MCNRLLCSKVASTGISMERKAWKPVSCFFGGKKRDYFLTTCNSVRGRIVLLSCLNLGVTQLFVLFDVWGYWWKSFLRLKIFWFGRCIGFGDRRKSIEDDKTVNMSCRHAGLKCLFLCLLTLRSRFLARCLSVELFCLVVAKCLQTITWKTVTGRNSLVILFFFSFFQYFISYRQRKAGFQQLCCSSLLALTPRKEPSVTEILIFPLSCCCWSGFVPTCTWCREEGGGGVRTRCANTYRHTNLNWCLTEKESQMKQAANDGSPTGSLSAGKLHRWQICSLFLLHRLL